MTLTDKLNSIFSEALNQWLHNNARGSCIIPSPLVDKCMITLVLHRIYGSKPNTKTLIICEDFRARGELIDFITNNSFDDDCAEIKRLIEDKTIRIYTTNFIEDRRIRSASNYSGNVVILYNVQTFGEFTNKCFISGDYRLAVYKNIIKDLEGSQMVFKHAPLLNAFKQSEVQVIKVSTPVEEMWIGTTLEPDSHERKLYDFYTQYIETSIRIFGDIKNLEYARKGNQEANISAAQICNNIAENNGWNERLDMSYDYNIKLDELYNPNALAERAEETYRKIRERRKLVSEYFGKLDKILEIVNENINKRILIINRSADFASIVTAYINEHSERNICGSYHNNLLPIPKVDTYGNQVYYKSGLKKGQPVELHAKAQQSLNVRLFKEGSINVLSTNNSPDVSLDVDIDVIIITSPLCSSIKTFLYRLSKVNYPNEGIKLYTLIVNNTIEEKALNGKDLALNHTIINKSEFEENSCTTFIVN